MTNAMCSYCGNAGDEKMARGPTLQICAPCVKRLLHTEEKKGTECAFCSQPAEDVFRLHPSQVPDKSVCGFCIENYADTL